ncbi:MAG: GTP-binding protein [bacterium]
MTPLVLVVGFLGSGKTTFLKNLMPALAVEGLTPELIINDYQNARIDAEQFHDLAAEVKALSGDCVCCGSRDELLETLRDFRHAPDRVMIIETNGTTDSGQLIESLVLDPSLKKFTPPVQLSVIDGKRWQRRFWHNALEREQARTASHLHISRADAISPERLEAVLESLRECGVRGKKTDPVSFAKELTHISENGWDWAAEEHRAACAYGDRNHSHAPGHEGHHFAACEIPLPESLDRKTFGEFMANLPREVLRAKGLAVFDDAPGEFFVFQKVGEDDQTRYFPVGREPRVKTPLLLVIGPSLPVEALEARVSALAASR